MSVCRLVLSVIRNKDYMIIDSTVEKKNLAKILPSTQLALIIKYTDVM